MGKTAFYSKKYPSGLISLEKSFIQNKINRRSDIIIYNRQGAALMLVECKAPHIAINQQVFDQAAAYNIEVKASLLVVSNGLNHYCFRQDFNERKWHYLKELPDYENLERMWI